MGLEKSLNALPRCTDTGPKTLWTQDISTLCLVLKCLTFLHLCRSALDGNRTTRRQTNLQSVK